MQSVELKRKVNYNATSETTLNHDRTTTESKIASGLRNEKSALITSGLTHHDEAKNGV